MKRFISCDWGTTALRLRLVDPHTMTVLAEAFSEHGISNTFELWKKSGKAENERLSFYQSVLTEQIKSLEQQPGISLESDPLIISGMASSNIGMAELPYKQMPFNFDGSDLEIRLIRANGQFGHNMLLISGAKTNDDIMRGEETQLIGCMDKSYKGERLYIFPGTHSKHVSVKDNKAVDVKTYMTGEFFELLTKKSILSNDIKKGEYLSENNITVFKKGIRDSIHANLLHNSFLIRANSVLGKSSKEENYYYLSGLLIGTELKELVGFKPWLSIVGNKLQSELYCTALNELGIKQIQSYDVSGAIVHGHCKMYDQYQSQSPGQFL